MWYILSLLNTGSNPVLTTNKKYMNNKIFTKSYYKGLFLILNDGFAVKIAESNGKVVFGKITRSFDKHLNLTKQEAILQFGVSKDYLDYFIENYERFKIIWNVNWEGHKIGDIYLPEHCGNYKGYPWNFVSHHIGYYRRDGRRAIEDGWKLGVKGLNAQIFNSFKIK
jgi:hypothetical protein